MASCNLLLKRVTCSLVVVFAYCTVKWSSKPLVFHHTRYIKRMVCCCMSLLRWHDALFDPKLVIFQHRHIVKCFIRKTIWPWLHVENNERALLCFSSISICIWWCCIPPPHQFFFPPSFFKCICQKCILSCYRDTRNHKACSLAENILTRVLTLETPCINVK